MSSALVGLQFIVAIVWLVYAGLEWYRTGVDPLLQLIRMLIYWHCVVVVVVRSLRTVFATLPADIERRRAWMIREEGAQL